MLGTIIGLAVGVGFTAIVIGFPVYVMVYYGKEMLENRKEDKESI